MLSLLLRVVNRFRPRDGWTPFLLSLTALLCAPAAILAMDRKPGAEGPLVLTILAAMSGLWLARSRLTARVAAVLAGLLGSCLVILIVAQLLPPPSFLWSEFLNAVNWLRGGQQGAAGQLLPFEATARYVWQRLTDLGVRLWWWSQTASSGGTASDPVVLLLCGSFLAWALGVFAMWQIYRRKSALLGMVPSGVALATIAFFGNGLTLLYLIVYLFCTLWLVAAWHLRLQQDRWQETGTDYPGDLGTELIITLSPALILILVVATFFPVFGPRQVRDAFWKVMDRPWAAVERVAEQLFGPIESGGGRGSPGSAGTLPRSHLLNGGPELGETIVLYVTTSDPAPPTPSADSETLAADRPRYPRRYWRSVTYDTYTGQGWINGPLEERTSSSNQPLQADLPPGVDLVQQFDVLLPEADAVYAVNAPVYVDHAVQAWWRAAGDLAQMTSPTQHYVAISRPPEPTIAGLRQASPFLPPQVAERYLALPETVSQRVLDLAHQVVGDQETRYDQARAIETYLRAYTYTLDLPDPPAGRDLVDYFLFDLQEGYCDYYASAMVVMARAVGIPARLASGYAQGAYDYEHQRWVVPEKDGHTWVEVYFDGIGWVEFEPTAGLPSLDRPGGEALSSPEVPPLPPHPLPWWQRVPWTLIAMGLVAILAIAFVFWLWRPEQQQGIVASDLVRDRYTRLLRWGARLKQPLRDGQTASEYAASLGEALHAHGQNARLLPTRRASAEVPAELEQLTDSFVRAQYDPRPIADREGWQIRDLWSRLRWHLWWLLLGKR